ncbi:MAG: M6 family metalloprotease domain-containing protein [archaeon]
MVLFVDFPVIKSLPEHNFEYFQGLLSSQEPGKPSIYNYYTEMSGGKFLPRFHLIEKWYTAEQEMDYYGSDALFTSTSKCSNELIDSANTCSSALFKEILAKALADGLSLQDYAHNSKTHVILIHAGANQADSSILHGSRQSLLHTKWQYLDTSLLPQPGVEIQSFVLVSEEDGIAAIAHEIGHELGLPELYDSDKSSDGIGLWGLMGLQDNLDMPAGLSAWSRVFLGWEEPVEIKRSGSYTFPIGKIYKIPITNTEYFLLENRHKSSFDSALPGEGILIWHIDDSVTNPKHPLFVNNNEERKRVDLEEAHDRSQDLDINNDPNLMNKRNYGESEDAWYFEPQSERCTGLTRMRLFPRCHQTDFTMLSTPNTNSNSGEVTGISVLVTSKPGPVMTANILLPDESEKKTFSSYSAESDKQLKLVLPTGYMLLLSYDELTLKKLLTSPSYTAAGLIFILDLIVFLSISTRKKGVKKK